MWGWMYCQLCVKSYYTARQVCRRCVSCNQQSWEIVNCDLASPGITLSAELFSTFKHNVKTATCCDCRHSNRFPSSCASDSLAIYGTIDMFWLIDWSTGHGISDNFAIIISLFVVLLPCCHVIACVVVGVSLCKHTLTDCYELLRDLASSHWVHSLCLGYFVCVRLFSCIIFACMLYFCNTVRWAWLDWGLSGWLTTLLQCFDTVGWVIGPVKTVGRITCCVGADVKPCSINHELLLLVT